MFRSLCGRNVRGLSSVRAHGVNSTHRNGFSASHGNIVRDQRFNCLDDSDIRILSDIVGPANALRDKFDVEPYNTDWMHKWSGNTGLVQKPNSTEQVSQILKYCNDRSLAVVPQGGNTGLVGGSIPVHDEIVLSQSRMNNILELNKVQGIVSVEAGVVQENLMTYLGNEGYVVPLDLGAKGSCQIGGNVSTNAGGLRLMRYGSLHGSVLGLEAVLADGTILDQLTAMRKDNTGIDLKHQFIGAEGSLGVITKVALLAPTKPASVKVLYLSVPTFEGVLAVMHLAKEYLSEILSACEYQDGKALRMTLNQQTHLRYPFEGDLDESRFFMVLETSGSNAQHDQEKLDMFLDSLNERVEGADGVLAENETQAASLWKLREGVAEGANKSGYVYKYDISLPVHRMDAFTTEVRERLAPFGAQTIGYGHLGDGNLHINVVTPQKDDRVLESIEPWLFEQLQQMKGSISAEHGLGQAKNEFILFSKPQAAVDIMQGIKKQMDPKHILNPYKFLPKN